MQLRHSAAPPARLHLEPMSVSNRANVFARTSSNASRNLLRFDYERMRDIA
jgi:hypothetical protein